MHAQRTLRRSISCAGIGLHSGNKVTLSLKPAPVDTGIRFRRFDLGGLEVPATVRHVGGINHATGLSRDAVRVDTVEHLLAAFVSLGVDNVIVELDNTEVPAADGSSAPFVDALEAAGVIEQDAERDPLAVLAPVRVADGDSELVAWPGDPDLLEIIYELDYGPDSPLGRQIQVRCKVGRSVKVSVPVLASWMGDHLDRRFQRAFGRALLVQHATSR